ncbi:MAG: hypothetical protein COB53_00365 [Elusimicrobia bacterium]|nr:MAG: hypothetical protein COB53_00365 [Elusimicrobiota bacterium]
MRVRMLTPGFYPTLGGAEKQALEISKALARAGVSVDVLTRRMPGLAAEETVQGIPVRRVFVLGSGLLNALSFFLSTVWRLLCDASDYDVIHVHLAGSPAIAACAASVITNCGVVVKIGGGRGIGEIAVSSRTISGRWKLRLLRWFAPRLIAVCEDLRSELEEHGLGAGALVVPNGVDLERYRPARSNEKETLREALHWPSGIIFLYTGRLSAEKQLPRFARAFKRACRATGVQARFVVLGAGPEADAIGKAGDETVILQSSTDAVEDRLRAADVFVLPSVSEGLSNALLEAMGSGLAVCASAVGGTKEAVVDGKTGLLFDFDDDEAMGAAIERYLRDIDLAPRFGIAGRVEAEKRFAMNVVAKRYMELYRAVEA